MASGLWGRLGGGLKGLLLGSPCGEEGDDGSDGRGGTLRALDPERERVTTRFIMDGGCRFFAGGPVELSG